MSGGPGQILGVQEGYRYELWSQNSKETACMILKKGGAFSCHWDGIDNYLARRGLGYDQTRKHQDIGRFTAHFDCLYKPEGCGGNSYLSIYGWTIEPLVEYYVIESWKNWIPSMASDAISKGSFTIDGSRYDIYENTRVNQPSIVGTATFKQYFSIRSDQRTSGTIDVSKHFDQWASLGMSLGKLHEVSFVVEGYQSQGNFDFTSLQIDVNQSSSNINEHFQSANHLMIMPNPVKDDLAIKFSRSAVNVSITIYDSWGKIVFTQHAPQTKQLIVSGLKNGIYFLNATFDNIAERTKLVVYE